MLSRISGQGVPRPAWNSARMHLHGAPFAQLGASVMASRGGPDPQDAVLAAGPQRRHQHRCVATGPAMHKLAFKELRPALETISASERNVSSPHEKAMLRWGKKCGVAMPDSRSSASAIDDAARSDVLQAKGFNRSRSRSSVPCNAMRSHAPSKYGPVHVAGEIPQLERRPRYRGREESSPVE